MSCNTVVYKILTVSGVKMKSTVKHKKRFGHSAKSVLSDPRQYLSFFFAFLIVQTLFWTLLITMGVNNRHAHETLTEEYEYHVLITGLSHSKYTEIRNQDNNYRLQDPELKRWPAIDFGLPSSSDGFGNRVYSIGLLLNENNPQRSLNYFKSQMERNNVGISQSNYELTPRYTDDPYRNASNNTLLIVLFIVCGAVSVLFGVLSVKFKKPPSIDSQGDRIYTSTISESVYATLRKAFFTFMIIFGATSLIFLLFRITAGNEIAYFFLLLFLIFVCSAFLTVLGNIRVNHYKFKYGIYMTFGASFKKLYSISAREMMTVSITSMPFSLGISLLICSLIYRQVGVDMTLPFEAILGLLVLNVIMVLASTYLPMKAMIKKPPVALLSAEDNSNLVASPRRSIRLPSNGFPVKYELFSMWRFRRYYLKLVAAAVAFSTVFLCGLYIKEMAQNTAKLDTHEFVLTATESGISESGIGTVNLSLSQDPAFKYIYWQDSTVATTYNIHALLRSENILNDKYIYDIPSIGGNREKCYSNGFTNTTDSFEMVAYSKTLIDTILENGIYSIDGDPYSVINNDNTVIISENINALAHYRFKVGDKIVLAVPVEAASEQDEQLLGGNRREASLTKYIENAIFEYKEYTVGAIIEASGESGNITVGLNYEAYSGITARFFDEESENEAPPLMSELLVFTKKDASSKDIARLRALIEKEFSLYDYKVSETYNTVRARLVKEGGQNSVVLTVSYLIMLLSPIVWFFSQLQFHRRRSKEFFILHSLGAQSKKLKLIYIVSGVVLSLFSAAVTLVMSYAADYLIYIFCSAFLSSDSVLGRINYSFYMPTDALIICIISAVLCGFLSSWLPLLFRKHTKSKSEYTSG